MTAAGARQPTPVLSTPMEELGIPEENLITLENIDDTDQATVQAAAESLIDEGCTLIIGASTGYSSFLPEIAEMYPEVTFAQWGNKVDGPGRIRDPLLRRYVSWLVMPAS